MKRSRRIFIIIGIVLVLIAVGLTGYGYYVYHSIKQTATEVYKPLKTGDGGSQQPSNIKIDKKTLKPINILLLGVDERKNDKGRSDTMIVVTLNPSTHSMLMTSIPRDTRVHIEGQSGYSKINAAYAYGDESLAVNTVSNLLDINISHYVKVNMEGLSDLVDAVDGVTVNNDISWYDKSKNFNYEKGKLHLNGDQALGYARMRHQDNRGDFGRNLRQRQVIEAIINKGKSFTSVSNMNDILDALGSNVTTNLSFDDMKTLALNYRQCRNNIKNYETKGTPKYINGVSWVLVSDQEKSQVHDMIAKQLKTK